MTEVDINRFRLEMFQQVARALTALAKPCGVAFVLNYALSGTDLGGTMSNMNKPEEQIQLLERAIASLRAKGIQIQ